MLDEGGAVNCPQLDDPQWALLGLRLTEPGGLTGWGVVAFLLFVMALGVVIVPVLERLADKRR